MNFEDQLHQGYIPDSKLTTKISFIPAVEAGVSTYSGHKVWSLSNAFVYCFTLATTIGRFTIGAEPNYNLYLSQGMGT